MNAEALFRDNLPLIDRVLDRVCWRARLSGADAEDFASSARISLMENDYAILRKYEGRSSLATFLAVVCEHLLADERVRQYGKWRASAEAERLGPAALLLERLLYREQRTMADAASIVRTMHPSLTVRAVEELAARLPARVARPRAVDVESMEELPVAAEASADERVVATDRQRLSNRAGTAVRRALAGMPEEDRALLRFRFGREMSVADISRMMRLPQRPLYRRLESLLERLRKTLEAEGIDASHAAELIGGQGWPPLEFDLSKGKSGPNRPSMQQEPQ
jgi:RNA polymerase sigma factor for flagellar operon FliA